MENGGVAPKLVVSTKAEPYARVENQIRLVVSYDLAAGAWGSGVLTYEGNDYPFSVSGLLVGDIGNSAELSGEVLNLRNLEDFNGSYTGFGAEAVVAGTTGAATLKNENGVIINIVPTTEGVEFKLGVDTVKIELQNRDKP
jgi:outer membrane immunogenic protein